jgi:hypothetical protein
MNLGFETCGNATLIVHDRGTPLLVTDPWVSGLQYFGSWSLPYRFSPEQTAAWPKVKWVWVSHGHPDHLNLESLELFRSATVLVPAHRGGRISSDLKAAGFKVLDLEDGRWYELSDRVRLLCFADWNQDATALIALGGRCGILNLNDGLALGHRAQVLAELAPFRRRFVLRLVNYGDADMMNYFTESGERIPPPAARKKPLGLDYSAFLKDWGGTHTAPFSCHHRYSRTDSSWAAAYATPLEDHPAGFNSARGELIRGYFSYDVTADRVTELPAEPLPARYHEPAEFGDDWSQPLEAEDLPLLHGYFSRFEHLRQKFEFINCRVGGRDHFVSLGGRKGVGITFEVPRASLVSAIRNEIFDDLLIANFMKTTLHGGPRSLYPDFTPYVPKYGDNGRAFSARELRGYFAAYQGAAGFEGWMDRLRVESARRIRTTLAANPALYAAARGFYRRMRA